MPNSTIVSRGEGTGAVARALCPGSTMLQRGNVAVARALLSIDAPSCAKIVESCSENQLFALDVPSCEEKNKCDMARQERTTGIGACPTDGPAPHGEATHEKNVLLITCVKKTIVFFIKKNYLKPNKPFQKLSQ